MYFALRGVGQLDQYKLFHWRSTNCHDQKLDRTIRFLTKTYRPKEKLGSILFERAEPATVLLAPFQHH